MEKFKSIPELIQSLNQLALRINKGTVGLEEFESKMHDARELYERLVILRFKAIEDRNLMGRYSGENDAAEIKEASIAEEPMVAAKQISLIDSIEEISREENTDEPSQQAYTQQPQNQQPAPPETQKTRPVEEPVKSDVIPPAEPPLPQNKATLPDSLAEKLSQTKIHDLNAVIGLNQKFRFIKELFNGNSAAYDHAIKSLNHCENFEEADQKTAELTDTYKWGDEDPLALALLNLIERRYQ